MHLLWSHARAALLLQFPSQAPRTMAPCRRRAATACLILLAGCGANAQQVLGQQQQETRPSFSSRGRLTLAGSESLPPATDLAARLASARASQLPITGGKRGLQGFKGIQPSQLRGPAWLYDLLVDTCFPYDLVGDGETLHYEICPYGIPSRTINGRVAVVALPNDYLGVFSGWEVREISGFTVYAAQNYTAGAACSLSTPPARHTMALLFSCGGFVKFGPAPSYDIISVAVSVASVVENSQCQTEVVLGVPYLCGDPDPYFSLMLANAGLEPLTSPSPTPWPVATRALMAASPGAVSSTPAALVSPASSAAAAAAEQETPLQYLQARQTTFLLATLVPIFVLLCCCMCVWTIRNLTRPRAKSAAWRKLGLTGDLHADMRDLLGDRVAAIVTASGAAGGLMANIGLLYDQRTGKRLTAAELEAAVARDLRAAEARGAQKPQHARTRLTLAGGRGPSQGRRTGRNGDDDDDDHVAKMRLASVESGTAGGTGVYLTGSVAHTEMEESERAALQRRVMGRAGRSSVAPSDALSATGGSFIDDATRGTTGSSGSGGFRADDRLSQVDDEAERRRLLLVTLGAGFAPGSRARAAAVASSVGGASRGRAGTTSSFASVAHAVAAPVVEPVVVEPQISGRILSAPELSHTVLVPAVAQHVVNARAERAVAHSAAAATATAPSDTHAWPASGTQSPLQFSVVAGNPITLISGLATPAASVTGVATGAALRSGSWNAMRPQSRAGTATSGSGHGDTGRSTPFGERPAVPRLPLDRALIRETRTPLAVAASMHAQPLDGHQYVSDESGPPSAARSEPPSPTHAEVLDRSASVAASVLANLLRSSRSGLSPAVQRGTSPGTQLPPSSRAGVGAGAHLNVTPTLAAASASLVSRNPLAAAAAAAGENASLPATMVSRGAVNPLLNAHVGHVVAATGMSMESLAAHRDVNGLLAAPVGRASASPDPIGAHDSILASRLRKTSRSAFAAAVTAAAAAAAVPQPAPGGMPTDAAMLHSAMPRHDTVDSVSGIFAGEDDGLDSRLSKSSRSALSAAATAAAAASVVRPVLMPMTSVGVIPADGAVIATAAASTQGHVPAMPTAPTAARPMRLDMAASYRNQLPIATPSVAALSPLDRSMTSAGHSGAQSSAMLAKLAARPVATGSPPIPKP